MSRDDELLVRAALSARLPWLSPDAEPEYGYSTDPQELIDKCCNCPCADCVDCIGGGKKTRKGRPSAANDLTAFAKLVMDGISVNQVCAILGIGRSTFYNYKNQLNMKGAIA